MQKKCTGWRSGLGDFGYEGMRATQRGHYIDNVVSTMYKQFEMLGLSFDEIKTSEVYLSQRHDWWPFEQYRFCLWACVQLKSSGLST